MVSRGEDGHARLVVVPACQCGSACTYLVVGVVHTPWLQSPGKEFVVRLEADCKGSAGLLASRLRSRGFAMNSPWAQTVILFLGVSLHTLGTLLWNQTLL